MRPRGGTELAFVSITYGAGGSTRDRTRDLVVKLNAERAFPAMAHLTCMGHTQDEIDELLDDYAATGCTTSWPWPVTRRPTAPNPAATSPTPRSWSS